MNSGFKAIKFCVSINLKVSIWLFLNKLSISLISLIKFLFGIKLFYKFNKFSLPPITSSTASMSSLLNFRQVINLIFLFFFIKPSIPFATIAKLENKKNQIFASFWYYDGQQIILVNNCPLLFSIYSVHYSFLFFQLMWIIFLNLY